MNTGTIPKRLYFPNLNGLRAIGASIVLIDHVEFLKVFFNLPSYSWFPFSGKIGVTLFFALSGFLITSLLFTERKATNTIQLKKFYLRRVLRILPLYYFIVILGIFVFSKFDGLTIPGYTDRMLRDLSWTNALILLFLIPNVTSFYIPYADQRWSIIVEEQFYLVQPFLLKFIKNRRSLILVFSFIVLSPEIVYLAASIINPEYAAGSKFITALTTQLKYLACIAVGCFFSILFFNRDPQIKEFLFKRSVQWSVLFIIIGLIVTGHFIYDTANLVDLRLFSVLFSIIVLNATQNEKNIFRLEVPYLNFLGKISYGIYMYHPVCIGIAIVIAKNITNNNAFLNFIIYPASIALTFLIAWLSYNYFEKFFLNLKPHPQLNKKAKKKADELAEQVPEPQQ